MQIQRGIVPFLLLAGSLVAADDPFTGKWKVNPSKSTHIDEMKVEAVGENRYAFTFSRGAVDTITTDGTDQPGLQGTTLSVTVEAPNRWKVVRKRGENLLIVAEWSLSADGRTLDDFFTGYRPDGSKSSRHYIYERTAGSSGFTGTWDNVSHEMPSSMELQIQRWERDGLSFVSSAVPMFKNLRFDANDYPDSGPNIPAGYSSSGRRVNERNLEITDKFHGAIVDTRQMEVSADLRTLTMSVRQAGESEPKNILVFDRQ